MLTFANPPAAAPLAEPPLALHAAHTVRATHAAQATQATNATRPSANGATSDATYWPCERLNAFILQMAAHGHCVSAAMMLGHRPYAVEQLAVAQQVADDALRGLATELQAYFDAPADSATSPLTAR